MNLDIFSFQRAFTARQKMALAACDCSSTLASNEAKDTLDALYLGLACEEMDCGEFCDTGAAIDEFITHCQTILQKLAAAEKDQVTIPLSNNRNLCLGEKNGSLQLQMNSEHITLPNLTFQHLYTNLIHDIQSYPDLYGAGLFSYASNLKPCRTTAVASFHTAH
jgi:hypothetical protein